MVFLHHIPNIQQKTFIIPSSWIIHCGHENFQSRINHKKSQSLTNILYIIIGIGPLLRFLLVFMNTVSISLHVRLLLYVVTISECKAANAKEDTAFFTVVFMPTFSRLWHIHVLSRGHTIFQPAEHGRKMNPFASCQHSNFHV